jgi:hypothetical protein
MRSVMRGGRGSCVFEDISGYLAEWKCVEWGLGCKVVDVWLGAALAIPSPPDPLLRGLFLLCLLDCLSGRVLRLLP